MLLNRSRSRGPDPLLEARMALFGGGAVMGLVGILRNGEGWWVPSAIGLLAVGMLVGMVQGIKERRQSRGEEGEE